MSKVYTDNIEKRTGGTAIALPASGKWSPTTQLDTTGTASATTFLRGDNSWAAVDTSGIQANMDDIALLAFKTQANGSLARYNLVDQSVDAFEDASGVDASASTAEARNASNYYYGEASVTPSITSNEDSTGVDGDYTWYKWSTVTAAGSYVNDTAQDHEYMIVAGGGGGGGGKGGSGAGGAGAGGYRTSAAFSLTGGTTYTITVGAGASSVAAGIVGADGSASSLVGSDITDVVSAGGGGGAQAHDTVSQTGRDGGSGGGAGGAGNASTGGVGGVSSPVTSPVQGYEGGDASGGGYGAGGGGSSAAGVDGGGGAGGAGTSNDIAGSSVTYAAGGGAASSNTAGSDGAANTGNAGGGAGQANAGGAGGSGIVVLRRLTGPVAAEGANMSLVSNTLTSVDAVTKGDIVLTYTNGTGTTSLNTDLVASVSRDNGANYTAATLVLQGTTGGHNIATAHDVTLGGTDTSQMRWKVVTANQAAATKTTRIQAVSLGWS